MGRGKGKEAGHTAKQEIGSEGSMMKLGPLISNTSEGKIQPVPVSFGSEYPLAYELCANKEETRGYGPRGSAAAKAFNSSSPPSSS